MRRFLLSPRWLLFHVTVLALVVLMVNLGLWQLHRLQDRREFNAEVRARATLEVVPVQEVVSLGTDADEVEWRTVTATGRYLVDEQVVVVNRSQDGVSGVNVVTPLQLDDGPIVLVNRGFVPGTLEVPAPTGGDVSVTGRLRRSQERTLGQLTEPEGELTEVFRIDIPRLADQLPGPVLPLSIDLLTSDPAEGAVPVPLPDPDLSEGPHLSYMVQWWIFSACAAVGWFLAVRRSVRQHRLDESVSDPDGRTPPDSPLPAEPVPATAPD
jgi:cytochrome oxidase assembly protein ShyY1